MRPRTCAAVLLALILWAAPTWAEASFNKQAASAQSASSGMLHPPTNVSFTRASCSLTLSWTPTVDARATGYNVLNGSSQLVPTITPKMASSQKISLVKNVSYSLTLVTTYLQWTSAPTQPLTVSC